jgi:uncharacterized membrane protein YgcG
MKVLLLTAGALACGQALTTDYSQASRLRVDVATTLSMETTAFSMERDGEPVENPRGGGGASTTEKRHVVQVDEYLEQADGRPTRVRRTFESVSFAGSMEFGDQSREMERESPFDGIVVELVVDEDGDVAAKVTEGSAPDDELLEGHQPDLALDALLPSGAVEVGDSWDLSGDEVVRALGFDVTDKLYPRPERSEGEGGREGRGGGRGRGGFGGGGLSTVRLFSMGEWEGSATLDSLTEEHDGQTCALIKIELECKGELPEEDFGGGRGRGRGGYLNGPALGSMVANEFQIEAEGKLYYSLADKRPIAFEIEGKLAVERRTERNSERGSMVISTSQEGTFTQTVSITAEESK